MPPEAQNQSRLGVIFAMTSFIVWGFSGLYWKELDHVPASEVIAHRSLWSAAFCFLLLLFTGHGRSMVAHLCNRKLVGILFTTGLLITINWGTFIWSIGAGRMVEASLGYFINPLVSIALGMIFLQERLSRPQLLAVGLTGAAVLYETISLGTFPWIALVLAFSFGFYGLLRKQAPVEATMGMFMETLLTSPLMLGYLAYLYSQGQFSFLTLDHSTDALMLGAGVVTAVPLMLYAAAAKRLRLVTLGLLFYVTPTGHLITAIFAFGEPLAPENLLTFVVIWAALAIYSLDLIQRSRKAPRTA